MSQISYRMTDTAGGGITQFTPGSGTSPVVPDGSGNINIPNGSNIDTVGSLNTLTINLVSSPSVSGSVTAGTGFSATTGNVAIVAGNLTLPTTSATAGNITINANRFVHSYGTGNTFLGSLSGNYTLTTATSRFNTSAGQETLNGLTSGGSNAIVGYQSGKVISSGSANQTLGSQNLLALTTGDYNTAVGPGAGYQLISGSSNLLLGGTGATQVGKNYTGAESSNILLHSVGVLGESNKIRIGTQGVGAGQQDACYIAGIYGTTVTTPQAVTIDSNGQLGSSATFGMTWSTITAAGPTAIAINSGYVVNFAGTATLTMPTVAAVGSVIEILMLDRTVGSAFSIDCNGRTIYNGNDTAVVSLTFTNAGAPASNLGGTLRMICVVANTTWQVASSTGNFVTV